MLAVREVLHKNMSLKKRLPWVGATELRVGIKTMIQRHKVSVDLEKRFLLIFDHSCVIWRNISVNGGQFYM